MRRTSSKLRLDSEQNAPSELQLLWKEMSFCLSDTHPKTFKTTVKCYKRTVFELLSAKEFGGNRLVMIKGLFRYLL